MKYDGLIAETVPIDGHNGDQIDAYLARPLGAGPGGSVVLIHTVPGSHAAAQGTARHRAYNGCPPRRPNPNLMNCPDVSHLGP